MANKTAITVARIAYLASDVVLSVQPARDQDSAFSAHLKQYAESKIQSLVAQSEGAITEVCERVHTHISALAQLWKKTNSSSLSRSKL